MSASLFGTKALAPARWLAPLLALAGVLAAPVAALAAPVQAWAGVGPAWPAWLGPLALGAALLGLAWGLANGPDLSKDEECGELWDIIQASRNKLKVAFDAIADPICTVTPQLRVESLNQALATMADRHPRDLVGLTAEEIMTLAQVPEAARSQLLDIARTVLDTSHPQGRLVESPTLKGNQRHYEVTATPVLDAVGRACLVIIQVRDVTVFKRMERTVREYSQKLEAKVLERTRDLLVAQEELQEEKEHLAQANQELLRLDTLRHDLTNMVVHDMKGPLAEIMGNLDLMSYDQLTEMQREALDLANMGSEDLLRMIMNLLDIDRLEEGKLAVHLQEVAFGELAGNLLKKFQTMIRLKGLDVAVEDGLPGGFAADPDLMHRVLQNLLTNALNHTAEGGQVRLVAQPGQEEGGVVLSVRDTGTGIPLRFQERIFQKFTQASDGQGPRTSTGLGLTFCKMAVEAHGGRIWLESQEGVGSTFSIWLPGQPEA